MDQVTIELDRSALGRMVLDGIIRDVVTRRRQLYSSTGSPGSHEHEEEHEVMKSEAGVTEVADVPGVSASVP